jgi:hypothetical protein
LLRRHRLAPAWLALQLCPKTDNTGLPFQLCATAE